MKKFLFTIFLLAAVFAAGASAQKGGGIIYKIPDNVMPMKWQGYKGMLMLAEKQPWGIFISYPEQDETIDALKARAEKSIARMFVHDDAKAAAIEWQSKTMSGHEGDSGAVQKQFEDEKMTFQLTFFEREHNGFKLIYGYFARKSKVKAKKDDDAEHLGGKDKGNKAFEAFWKSFK